jgi:hypothetical protein
MEGTESVLSGVNALDSNPSRSSSPSNWSAQLLFSRGELLPLTVPSGAGSRYVPVNRTTQEDPELDTTPWKESSLRLNSFHWVDRILFLSVAVKRPISLVITTLFDNHIYQAPDCNRVPRSVEVK